MYFKDLQFCGFLLAVATFMCIAKLPQSGQVGLVFIHKYILYIAQRGKGPG